MSKGFLQARLNIKTWDFIRKQEKRIAELEESLFHIHNNDFTPLWKKVKELEQKMGDWKDDQIFFNQGIIKDVNDVKQEIKWNFNRLTEHQHQIDTLSAGIIKHIKWHMDKSPYETIQEQLEELDGTESEPQFPEYEKFTRGYLKGLREKWELRKNGD